MTPIDLVCHHTGCKRDIVGAINGRLVCQLHMGQWINTHKNRGVMILGEWRAEALKG